MQPDVPEFDCTPTAPCNIELVKVEGLSVDEFQLRKSIPKQALLYGKWYEGRHVEQGKVSKRRNGAYGC